MTLHCRVPLYWILHSAIVTFQRETIHRQGLRQLPAGACISSFSFPNTAKICSTAPRTHNASFTVRYGTHMRKLEVSVTNSAVKDACPIGTLSLRDDASVLRTLLSWAKEIGLLSIVRHIRSVEYFPRRLSAHVRHFPCRLAGSPQLLPAGDGNRLCFHFDPGRFRGLSTLPFGECLI